MTKRDENVLRAGRCLLWQSKELTTKPQLPLRRGASLEPLSRPASHTGPMWNASSFTTTSSGKSACLRADFTNGSPRDFQVN